MTSQRGNSNSQNRQSDTHASNDIRLVTEKQTLEEIRAFRKVHYASVYPNMDLDNDSLDESAFVLFTRDENGDIASCARLAVGGSSGLTEEKFLGTYREAGLCFMEWGRFIIATPNRSLLKRYYRAVHRLAKTSGADAIVISMKCKDIPLHQRLIGVEVLASDTGEAYGGANQLACVVWHLDETKQRFFDWLDA